MANKLPISLMPSNDRLVKRRLAFVRLIWTKPTNTTHRSTALSAVYHNEERNQFGQMVKQVYLNNPQSEFIWYSKKPTKPQIQLMLVNIQSLLFIDYPIPAGRNEWAANLPHLQDVNEFQPQCGIHILHNVWGKIKMLWFYYIPSAQSSYMETYTDVNAIYPSPRFNENTVAPNPLHSLLLGLYFPRAPPNPVPIRVGERYYSRYNKPPAIEKLWGVREITEEYLQDLQRMRQIPVGFRFIAIYVCSGAKLLLMDSHTNNNANHNRSLIQSGGVIVAAGLIDLRGPLDVNVGNPLNLEEAVDNQYFIGSDKTLQRIRGIQNPVIFLAPNESQYESIAWSLIGQAYDDPNGHKRWCLYAPEGGRIVAIEEWRDGMDEIMARHLYERLHKATVTCEDPNYNKLDYQFPNVDMRNRILGIGDYADRELSVNINAVYPDYSPRTDLLVQYPKYVLNALPIDQAFRPPLWPPVLFDVKDTTKHSLIPLFEEEKTNCQTGWGHLWVVENGWDYRCKWKDTPFQFPRYEIVGSNISHELRNPEENYMGLDGWMHWYALDNQNKKNKIGTYTTGAYVAVAKTNPNTDEEIDLKNWN